MKQLEIHDIYFSKICIKFTKVNYRASTAPPSVLFNLPPKIWVFTWPAPARVFPPARSVEERAWVRGWRVLREVPAVNYIFFLVILSSSMFIHEVLPSFSTPGRRAKNHRSDLGGIRTRDLWITSSTLKCSNHWASSIDISEPYAGSFHTTFEYLIRLGKFLSKIFDLKNSKPFSSFLNASNFTTMLHQTLHQGYIYCMLHLLYVTNVTSTFGTLM